MTRDTNRPSPRKASLGYTGSDLLDALAQPGCPVCTLVQRGVDQYLDRISYDSVNDLTVRDELRKSIGYCAVHGQQWLHLRNTLGTAIIYFDVLTNVRRAMAPYNSAADLGEAAPARLLGRLQGLLGQAGGASGKALADAVEPTLPCPACRQSERATEEAIGAFAASLHNRDFIAAYREHQTGLCLPHLRLVLRRLSDPSLVCSLAEIQEAVLARTCADLAEVIRKYDYRFQHEAKGPEFAAPARAVEQAAGRLPTQLNPPQVPAPINSVRAPHCHASLPQRSPSRVPILH